MTVERLKYRMLVGSTSDETYNDYTSSAISSMNINKALSSLPVAHVTMEDIGHTLLNGTDLDVNYEIKLEASKDGGATYATLFRGSIDDLTGASSADGVESLELDCAADTALRSNFMNLNQCVQQSKNFGAIVAGQPSLSDGTTWTTDSSGNYPDGILYGLGYSYDGPIDAVADIDDVIYDGISFQSPYQALDRFSERFGYSWYIDTGVVYAMPKSYISNFTASSYTAKIGNNINKFALTKVGRYNRDALIIHNNYPFFYRKGTGAEKDITFYDLNDQRSIDLNSVYIHGERFYPYVTGDVYEGSLTVVGTSESVLGKLITISDPDDVFNGLGNVVSVTHDLRSDRWSTKLSLENPERSDAQTIVDLENKLEEYTERERSTEVGEGMYYIDTFTASSGSSGFLPFAIGFGTSSANASQSDPVNMQDIYLYDDEIGVWDFYNIGSSQTNYPWREFILFGNDTKEPYLATTSMFIGKPHWGNDVYAVNTVVGATQSYADYLTASNANVSMATYSFEDYKVSFNGLSLSPGAGLDCIFGWKDTDTSSDLYSTDRIPDYITPTDTFWSSGSVTDNIPYEMRRYLGWDYYSKSDTSSYYSFETDTIPANHERNAGMLLTATLPGNRRDYQGVSNIRVLATMKGHGHMSRWLPEPQPKEIHESNTTNISVWNFYSQQWDNWIGYPGTPTYTNDDGDMWMNVMLDIAEHHDTYSIEGGVSTNIGVDNKIYILLNMWLGENVPPRQASWDSAYGGTFSVGYVEVNLDFEDGSSFLEIPKIRGDHNEFLAVSQPMRKILGLYTASDWVGPAGNDMSDYSIPTYRKGYLTPDGYDVTTIGYPMIRKQANTFPHGKSNWIVENTALADNYDWYSFIDEIYEDNNAWDKKLYVHYIPESFPLDYTLQENGHYFSRSCDGSEKDNVIFYLGDSATTLGLYDKIPYYMTTSVEYKHVGYDGDAGGGTASGGIITRKVDTVGVDKTAKKRAVVQWRTASV